MRVPKQREGRPTEKKEISTTRRREDDGFRQKSFTRKGKPPRKNTLQRGHLAIPHAIAQQKKSRPPYLKGGENEEQRGEGPVIRGNERRSWRPPKEIRN